jgi:hypothetical protein
MKTLGALKPSPIPPIVWINISIEFIVGIDKSRNKLVIMVVVNQLSKYNHFCTLQHPFKYSTVSQVFMDNIFKLHGLPFCIVMEHDPTFTSNFWKELFKLQGTLIES